MKVSVENQEVTVTASGMEFLRLKTEINKRIGHLTSSSRDFVKFPVSALPEVKDLLDSSDLESGAVKTYLNAFSAHASARTKAMEILEENIVDGLPERWLSVLDPAQASAVAAMILPDLLGLCLFDEQGSGKTVMALAAFDILKESGTVDGMIVVCPKSMVSEWPKDIKKFLPGKYRTVEAEGDRRRKYEAALTNFDVLITNYEGIDVMLTSLVGIAGRRKFLLVVDESYYLKNQESLRSEKTLKLRDHCRRCFVLCGTPAPNSAYDLINQFNLADLGYTYGGFTESGDPDLDRDKIADLAESRGLFIRRLKTEILLQVPRKDFRVVSVKLKGRQELMYRKAETDLELELKTLDNETFKKRLGIYFQRRSVLLQICCCPSAIDPAFTETPVKYEKLDELLAELTSSGRKVILWSYYRRSLDELTARYANYEPVRVDGSVSTPERKEAVRRFQESPSTLLFIANPAAAGAGLTLHAAYDAIYVSYSNQAAHYLQSLDRIHRRGQSASQVNYYLIVCENTVEETEIIRLRGKEMGQHRLLGDQVPWPTSLDDALNELNRNA